MHRVAEVGVAAHWDYKDAYNATSNESMPNPLASESNTAKSITTEKEGDDKNHQLKVKDFEKFVFSSLASNNNELIEADNAFSILSHSLSKEDSWLNFEQRKSGIKIKCLYTNQDEVKDCKDDIIILKNGVTATMFDIFFNCVVYLLRTI